MAFSRCVLQYRACAWVLIASALLLECTAQGQAEACVGSGDDSQLSPAVCGDNSVCDDGVCECESQYLSPTGTNTDCIPINEADSRCTMYDQNCIFCGSDFQGPCMKCVVNLNLDGTRCVSECSSGDFSIIVLPNTSITARVCGGSSSGGSSSLPQWAVVVIPVLAGVAVIIFIIFVIIFAITVLNRSSGVFAVVEDSGGGTITPTQAGTLRTRRSNSFQYRKQTNQRDSRDSAYFAGHENPTFSDATEEEAEFTRKLDYLRTQAEVFLRMLNDMRRRLKELPPDAPAAIQYRNVMRDVTRLLYLLNKKPSTVQMPPDGVQLLNWSEQILNRYLSSQQGQAPRGIQQQPNRLSAIGDQIETQF